MDKAFEDLLDRVQTAPGVSDIVVIQHNEDTDQSSLVRSTLDDKETALKYGKITKGMFDRASDIVKELDPTNEMFVFKIGTRTNLQEREIIVAPEDDLMVTVFQNLRHAAHHNR